MNDPLLNKGTAFTGAERDTFDLHGLLPPHVSDLDLQVSAGWTHFTATGDLGAIHIPARAPDTNETLFYALLTRNMKR